MHFKSQLTGLQDTEHHLALMLILSEPCGFTRKPICVARGLLAPAGRTVCEWHFTLQISVWSLCGAAKRACVRRKVTLSPIILSGRARASELWRGVQRRCSALAGSAVQEPRYLYLIFHSKLRSFASIIVFFFSHSSDIKTVWKVKSDSGWVYGTVWQSKCDLSLIWSSAVVAPLSSIPEVTGLWDNRVEPIWVIYPGRFSII